MFIVRAHLILADQATTPIHIRMQFVAAIGLAAFDRPACIHILLRALGLVPVFRHLVLFELRILPARVALHRRTDNARINQLPGYSGGS